MELTFSNGTTCQPAGVTARDARTPMLAAAPRRRLPGRGSSGRGGLRWRQSPFWLRSMSRGRFWRATLPMEIDVNEPWNAYQVDSLLAGRPLYPSPDSLVCNNYPPLSYYCVAAIALATSADAILIGRVLSLLATLAAAAAVGIAVLQGGASRSCAWLAALWFLATIARFFDLFVGMNYPHIVSLALMLWALVWLVGRQRNGRAVEPAILLMVLAGFYKHSLWAVPATALCWLALSDRRRAIRAAAVGAGAAALGLVLCRWIYGDAFFGQLLWPRHCSLGRAVNSLGRLQWIAPALVVSLLWAWDQRGDKAARFILLFVAAAFATHFLQQCGDGLWDNSVFELLAAVAIGLGLGLDRVTTIRAFRRWRAERATALIVSIAVARLLASDGTIPYRLIFSPELRASLPRKRPWSIPRALESPPFPVRSFVSCRPLPAGRASRLSMIASRWASGSRPASLRKPK